MATSSTGGPANPLGAFPVNSVQGVQSPEGDAVKDHITTIAQSNLPKAPASPLGPTSEQHAVTPFSTMKIPVTTSESSTNPNPDVIVTANSTNEAATSVLTPKPTPTSHSSSAKDSTADSDFASDSETKSKTMKQHQEAAKGDLTLGPSAAKRISQNMGGTNVVRGHAALDSLYRGVVEVLMEKNKDVGEFMKEFEEKMSGKTLSDGTVIPGHSFDVDLNYEDFIKTGKGVFEDGGGVRVEVYRRERTEGLKVKSLTMYKVKIYKNGELKGTIKSKTPGEAGFKEVVSGASKCRLVYMLQDHAGPLGSDIKYDQHAESKRMARDVGMAAVEVSGKMPIQFHAVVTSMEARLAQGASVAEVIESTEKAISGLAIAGGSIGVVVGIVELLIAKHYYDKKEGLLNKINNLQEQLLGVTGEKREELEYRIKCLEKEAEEIEEKIYERCIRGSTSVASNSVLLANTAIALSPVHAGLSLMIMATGIAAGVLLALEGIAEGVDHATKLHKAISQKKKLETIKKEGDKLIANEDARGEALIEYAKKQNQIVNLALMINTIGLVGDGATIAAAGLIIASTAGVAAVAPYVAIPMVGAAGAIIGAAVYGAHKKNQLQKEEERLENSTNPIERDRSAIGIFCKIYDEIKKEEDAGSASDNLYTNLIMKDMFGIEPELRKFFLSTFEATVSSFRGVEETSVPNQGNATQTLSPKTSEIPLEELEEQEDLANHQPEEEKQIEASSSKAAGAKIRPRQENWRKFQAKQLEAKRLAAQLGTFLENKDQGNQTIHDNTQD